MNIKTDAIYEGGVLHPLTPLDLPEHGVVSLSISPATAKSAEVEAARQRNVLLAYVAEVESQPSEVVADKLSNRDHDRLLYGE